MSNQNKMIGLSTFIGLTMALCATVRSIPTLVSAGWTLVTYIIFAVVFFVCSNSIYFWRTFYNASSRGWTSTLGENGIRQ